MKNLAAIDIGSNAIRLVIAEVHKHEEVHITKKIREPIRLGEDVFKDGLISKKNIQSSVECFKQFQQLIKSHDVQKTRAFATSALREAKNQQEFIDEILKHTGIAIECISGEREAALICSGVEQKIKLQNKKSVLIDIGGGSVEVSVVFDSKIKALQSFKVGMVRLLQLIEKNNIPAHKIEDYIESQCLEIKSYLRENLKNKDLDFCVGTGGNFESLGKLRVALLNKTSIYSIHAAELKELYHHLASMSLKERIKFLKIRPDRADVIIPACVVSLYIMKLCECEILSIPHVGLRDGILSEMIQD